MNVFTLSNLPRPNCLRPKLFIRKFIFVCISISFLPNTIQSVFAQQANIWYFHQRSGLNFNTTPPTVLSNGAIVTPTGTPGMEGEGVASIADNSGNLLFYTDGINVYNKVHAIMTNGTGLLGHPSSAQSAIIIPKPGSTTNYFIVTAPLTNTTDGIRYSEVDMTSGNGQVLTGNKNTLISPASTRMMEAVCAMPHDNGTDYWLITHQGAGSNNYYKHLVTSTGISTGTAQAIGYTVGAGGSDIGMMKANTCYNQIATSFHPSDVVDIVNFNNATGTLSSATSITNFTAGDGVYGLEYSTNSTYLYVTGLYNKILYQFNISSGIGTTIDGTRQIIGYAAPGADRLAGLQLGPDGKIYAANHSWGPYNDNAGTQTYIGTISNPNNAGAACNWNNIAISIPSINVGGVYTGVKHGLPTLLKSLVARNLKITTPATACINENITFTYAFSGSGTVVWDFGDGSSTSTVISPNHSYSNENTYTITLTVTDNCGKITTATKTITIVDGRPTVNYTCSGGGVTLTGTNPGTGNSGYLWFGNSGYNTYLGNTNTYTKNPITLPQSFRIYGTGALTTAAYTGQGTGYPNYNNINYMTFDANIPFYLKSIDVKPGNWEANCNGPGTTATFTLTKGGTPVATKSVVIDCSGGGIRTIDLDFGIPAGSGYKLESNIGFYYVSNAEAAAFPWNNSSVVTYTGSGPQPMSNGGPFSNWKIYTSPNNCSVRQIDLTAVNCSLPIHLINFTATLQNGAVYLNWSTSLETNNDYFEIQRSIDGKHFESISIVKGSENTSHITSYQFVDYNPYSGVSYYTVKQVDINKNSESFPVRSIINEENKTIIYPNPSEGVYSIQVGKRETIVKVDVYNELGQLIITKNSNADTSTETIDLTNESNGIYYLLITTPNKVESHKIIKK